MSDTRLQLYMVAGTIILFCSTLAVNELLFTRLEFAPGINWIYLPAGMRLLCILLFAEAGAVGILLASWGVCFFYFFPQDVLRSLAGGVIAALAPYLVYRLAPARAGASLVHLTPLRLLAYAVAFSISSPLLHHIWFGLQGGDELLESFAVMAAGDLAGTLIVLYAAKYVLAFAAPAPPPSGPHR